MMQHAESGRRQLVADWTGFARSWQRTSARILSAGAVCLASHRMDRPRQ